MKKLLFICNAYAGRMGIQSKMYPVLDIFEKNGYITTVRLTQAHGDPIKIVEEIDEHYDLLVCCGGDGTLDETVNGMMRRKDKIPIGYIPAGSTNDFGRTLHISTNIKTAAQRAVTGDAFLCDIGQLNDEYFVYVAAFGVLSAITYETSQSYKNVLGYLAYVLSGVRELSSITSYHMLVETDNETVEGDYIFGMVTNSESVGGFKSITGKNVLLDDGVFEVTLVKTPGSLIELQETLASIISRKMDKKYIYSTKTSTIKLTADQMINWNIDGENGGSSKSVTITNHQKAISFIKGGY